MKEIIKVAQAEYKFECCGTDKDYTDWGPEIPDSCHCAAVHQDTATCYQVEVTRESQTWMSEQVEVYKEPCVPYLLRIVNEGIDILFGICFGFALVALIGMIMALVMVSQINSVNEDPRGPPHHALQRSAFV
ncbi:tetraspanin-8-like [Alosa pseudoharengus]|uniref:tetraspanin-8-like n=1 Tax=Alosa pseudoharengus TaxID=34774 RepID=UPI003F88FED3